MKTDKSETSRIVIEPEVRFMDNAVDGKSGSSKI